MCMCDTCVYVINRNCTNGVFVTTGRLFCFEMQYFLVVQQCKNCSDDFSVILLYNYYCICFFHTVDLY